MSQKKSGGGDTIKSEVKKQSPPDAVGCCLVDHANARTLFAVFDKVCAENNDEMVEKIVHTIHAHCRMHNQAMVDVVLPLVMNMSKGGEMGEKMQAKLLEVEGCLDAVDKAEKHLSNPEFVEGMQKQKAANMELMQMTEAEVLPAMMEELDAKALASAAEQMEAVKNKAPLTPQITAAA